MKSAPFRAIGIVFLFGVVSASAKPKTVYPVKIPDGDEELEPYRYNGVVRTEEARGSGFCAWNSKAFFSAAHVVFDDAGGKWGAPPVWYPRPNWLTLNEETAIQARGYFRWSSYANLVMDPQNENIRESFSRDVILGFAFKNLITRAPATLNRNGAEDLQKKASTLITGYPAENAYTGKPIEGYSQYATGPAITTYKPYLGDALQTTLLTTGRGNSGGPVWTRNGKTWNASGVLVGGLPSEAVVYAFSSDINSLTKAARPVINNVPAESISVKGVSSTSRFFGNKTVRQIPDGKHRWTDIPVQVTGFKSGSTISSVKVSLEISTTHRGDLQVMLTAPGGYQALLHNEQGGGARNLILTDMDVTTGASDVEPSGTWKLRVQDRLKGDIATFKSVQIEIAVEEAAVQPAPAGP